MKPLHLYLRHQTQGVTVDIPVGVVFVPAIPALAAIIAVYITAVTGLFVEGL